MTDLSTATRGVSPPTSELDSLLERRERAEALMTQAIDMIAEANGLTPDRNGGLSRIGLASELRSQDWYGIDKPESRERLLRKCLDEFDRCGWLYLLRRSHLSELMSKQDKEAYYKELQKNPPPLTRENVTTTFVDLFGNRQATWRRGVVELFASLRGSYKSHDAFKVGLRMIVPNAFATAHGGWNFFRHADDQVDDLQRIIHLIQERDPPEARWSDTIERQRRGGATGYQAGPVEFRWFKNGSLHIWMQDDTIIAAINEIIAEHYGATLAGRRS
ncbi:DUF4942 domain-containing protein [Halomonas sp. ATCH28]|uniref:DUF4942 domain-containing protein n=1 Tax=Halomonas gemina TaxID=2945105 RepID=A0ABT0SVU8_9GAMM|nr:DUF4942 domain-containing protein [Halomonas gemina]MCL7938786.1 DUF4942 domain-containing protein [Halomonas gemina]